MLQFDATTWGNLPEGILSFCSDISFPQQHAVRVGNSYDVHIAVPGFSKDMLSLTVTSAGFQLVGKAPKTRQNCYTRDFSALVYIPPEFDKEKATAVTENGLCYIEVPLRESQRTKIPIN